MDFLDDPNWLAVCPEIGDITVDDIPVAAGNGLCWEPRGFSAPVDAREEDDYSIVAADGFMAAGSKKWYSARSVSCSAPQSKASREKMRRNRFNDRFLELGSVLESTKSPKMDKSAILSGAARLVTQLRAETQKLKDTNEILHEKINELKAEKNELRDKKQWLNVEKENLEQQVKILNARPGFYAQATMLPAAFAPQGHCAGPKVMMPVLSYPGFPMWQFMPQADIDTSKDAESCPPVA